MDDTTAGNAADGATATRPSLLRTVAHRLAGDSVALPDEGRLASFARATGWLNSEPLSAARLNGRVVLVDFWTYTCVNWLRTLPYVRAWAEKYEAAGLTVVGVHTPEFGFERDLDNVVAQSRKLGVEYPVAIDSDYGVWRDFANHFWPAIYVADADGRIRYHHFGEGEYAMTEMAIQQLVGEANGSAVEEELVMVEPRGLEVAADWRTLQSPETYLGFQQATGFASAGMPRSELPRVYSGAERLPLNHWDLSGTWTVGPHAAILAEPGGRVAFQFHARDVNLVMGPSSKGSRIPFRVFLDGAPAANDHGTDVDSEGRGVVDDQRTYQLIRQSGPIPERRFEIEFLEAGAEAYCFTFG
jgi:thiol-disulfide isomerase/thioredoxin